MNAQDWVRYFASRQPERKADWLDTAAGILGGGVGMVAGGPAGAVAGYGAGRAIGGAGENAVNGQMSIQDLMALLRAGASGAGAVAPFNIGGNYAAGGTVTSTPSPEALALLKQFLETRLGATNAPGSASDPYLDKTPVDLMGKPPAQPQMAQASHPGWEAFATIAGDVLGKLPGPRPSPGQNKTIGAYMPAAGALVGGVPKYAADKRAEKNKLASEDYLNKSKEYQRGLTDVQVALIRRKMGADGAEELSPEQYESLGVPKEYRTTAGYKAWIANRSRGDSNIGRLTLAARTNKDISQFPDVRDSYLRISDSAAEGGKTGLSDMALVFSFMRVLDPTSVVREGEYERAVKTAGIPAWVWSAYQRAASGKFLHPDQRADMVRLASLYYNRKRDAYRNAREWLDKLAAQYGVDPSLAIPNLEKRGTQIAPVDPTVPDQSGERDKDGYLVPPTGATSAGGQ